MLSHRFWLIFSLIALSTNSYFGYKAYRLNEYNFIAIKEINKITSATKEDSKNIRLRNENLSKIHALKNSISFAEYLQTEPEDKYIQAFYLNSKEFLDIQGSYYHYRDYIDLYNRSIITNSKCLSEYYKAKFYNKLILMKLIQASETHCFFGMHRIRSFQNNAGWVSLYYNHESGPSDHVHIEINDHEVKHFRQDSIIINRADTLNGQLKYSYIDQQTSEIKTSITTTTIPTP